MGMTFPGLLAAAGLIWCVVPAAAQPAQPEPSSVIPQVPARPPEVAGWRVVFSPTAVHFSDAADHKAVVLLGLERERHDGLLWGGAVFRNSFGQPSAYVYGGQRLYGWSPWSPLFADWSAGLLYGYVGEYKDKVPINYKGFSPAIIAGLGWQFTPALAGHVHLLGASALLVSISVRLP